MPEPNTLKVIATGDIALHGHYPALMREHGIEHPFRQVLDAWRGADLLLGNLESPITAAPRAAPSKVTLRAEASAALALKRAGFQAVSLANNHAMDYGPGGLQDTISALDASGVPHLGAGPDEAQARAPLVLNTAGGTVGLLAYCDVEQKSPLYAGPSQAGVSPFRIDEVIADIAALRPRVDWLIVQLHWGMEMARIPSPGQRAEARRIAEAGADLIVGHHPHVLQPLEMIGRVPVFYSLGNFLFSEMYWRGTSAKGESFVSRLRLHPLSMQTGWAEVTLSKAGAPRAQLRPARLRRGDLQVVPEPTRKRAMQWQQQCAMLAVEDYEKAYRQEDRLASARTQWRWKWKPLHRRIEMYAFKLGLLPHAVEGT